MPDDDRQVGDGRRVSVGESIYDADGRELGRVRGLDEHGFYVTTADGVVAMSVEHEADTMAGEKELMWRCWKCGEMGELEGGFPETCPNCDAPKEDIYVWTED